MLSRHTKDEMSKIAGGACAGLFATLVVSLVFAIFGGIASVFGAETTVCAPSNAYECTKNNRKHIDAHYKRIGKNREDIDIHHKRINQNRDAAKNNRETNYAQDKRIDSNQGAIKINRETNYAQDKRIDSNQAATTFNRNAISANSARIDSAFTQLGAMGEDIDALQSGVAMAVAMANAPIVTAPGKHFSLSGGVGYFDDKIATAIKFAVVPNDFTAVNVSVGYDFDKNVTVGAGAGFAF